MSAILVWSGLGVLAMAAIIGILLASSGNGVWLVAYLPIVAVASGAIVVAGREEL